MYEMLKFEECQKCGAKIFEGDSIYKDQNGFLCEDCLIEKAGIKEVTTSTYFLDGEYVGDENEYDEVLEVAVEVAEAETAENIWDNEE